MGKMAVTSDNHEVKENMSKEDIEQRHITNNIRPGINVVPTKKKTFKITSVKLNDTNDGDSMDDLDESHTEMTEDYSSEILDTSHATDYEQETPSAAEDMPLTNRQVGDGKEKTETEMHSRFRVVKIETKEPFHRGRWICLDFLDPQPAVNPEKSDIKVYDEANSGSSSAGSSIHYIHGVDDPAKNPLLAGATGTVYNATSQPTESQSTSNQVDTFQPIHPAPNTAQSNMSSNPQSQLSLGYYPDSSQGQGTNQLLGQTLNQSHSHQSINTVASVDNVQNVSGQPMIGDVLSGQATSHTQSETSSIQQPNVYPHFSSGHAPQIPGTSMAYQPHNQATSQNTSVAGSTTGQPTSAQNQDQTSSTYQTFVNLGQQTANPGIANEKDESIPSEVATALNLTLDVPNSTSDTVNHMDAMQSESGTSSRAENHLTGELDRDLNVIQNQNALPALAAAVEDLQSPQEEDQGGSSTVAIDNKIEQAMDLVKSHLMFAVREEVEVLKEQIAELIERNNQLEYENGILRAAASPETLAKLAAPRQQPPSSSS